ncbi:MAG: peptide ABC transporter substrate-binding protein [Treponema sp.]|nr:peptide ABC transporter substrate-binding protein [Treponema sp.]
MKLSGIKGFSIRERFRVSLILGPALLLFCVLLLGACQTMPGRARGPVAQTQAGSNFAGIRPLPQAWDELVVAFSRSQPQFDFRRSYLASEAQLFTAIYEGLFSYHPQTMEPVPAAAQSWEVSQDRREWTFTIRENARFQNGDPVRAEDFRASWLSTLEPERNAPYSSLFDIIEGAREFRLGTAAASDVGIFAPAERTLVVRLNSPVEFFPSMLCHHAFSPIHPSMLREEDWSARLPVSNGPFYIAEMDSSGILFARNPYYWDAPRVSMSRITIRFVDDGAHASALWNSGEVRWIHGAVCLETLMDRSNIQVNAMFATQYYFVRSSRPPWGDFRLRRALSLALPWQEIRHGHLLPATTLIFPIPGYPRVQGLYATDAQQARLLLAEAGYPGGEGLPELVIRIPPSQDAQRIAGIMARSWRQALGVQARIDVVPFERFLDSLHLDDYDVGTVTWIGDFADPWTFLKKWSGDSNLNHARHSDDEFEALIDRSMSEEGARRWETLAEAETLLLSRGNVLPISFSLALNIINLNEIEGWYPNVLDIHPFKYLGFRARSPLPGVALGPPGTKYNKNTVFYLTTR